MAIVSLMPRGRRVLVQHIKPKEKKSGSIIIPVNVDQEHETCQGKIVALPELPKDESPLYLEIGDVVIYPRHTAVSIIFDNDEFLVLHEDDILAIVRGQVE